MKLLLPLVIITLLAGCAPTGEQNVVVSGIQAAFAAEPDVRNQPARAPAETQGSEQAPRTSPPANVLDCSKARDLALRLLDLRAKVDLTRREAQIIVRAQGDHSLWFVVDELFPDGTPRNTDMTLQGIELRCMQFNSAGLAA